VRLVQRPVRELEGLRGARRALGPRDVPAGTTPLAAEGVAGQALDLEAVFELPPPGAGAREFGLKVRTGPGEETVVGVDAAAGRLFVDRRRSGRTGFHKDFTANGRETAPLPAEGGRGAARVVRLRVLVDRSSVEVFAGGGRVAITDQIFPSPASDGVALYAVGGAARLLSLEAWPMRPGAGAGGAQAAAPLPGPGKLP
jgi:sucrose-6-phosphate hydrolase SacC (GH32 family)